MSRYVPAMNKIKTRAFKSSPVITLTEAIVRGAIANSSSHCMWAEAIRAQVKDAVRIAVDIHTIRFTIGNKRYVYLTPRAIQESILIFDRGEFPRVPHTVHLRNAQVIESQPMPKETKKRLAKYRPRAKLAVDRSGTPTKQGGTEPPSFPRHARRREFGIRAFEKKMSEITPLTATERIAVLKDAIKSIEAKAV